ncbi:MAG: FtsQ-type POTRA domain-containing protein [Coleofasciculus sp. Co-bin14]|nr:FtsQ-type POTRA domain-containing protein [Coleofasciculus sp. Co-bin14]
MESIASVTQAELTHRRKKLRRARRLKSFQAFWRSLFVGGMASGLVWALTLPDWVIRQPEQVVIEGNHLLSTKAIRSLLPLSYPQSILRVQPQVIANSLESQAPIAKAIVSRQLLPPGLTIQIKERKPVALAQATATQNTKTSHSTQGSGLLDEQGIWIPQSSYTKLEQNIELPTLKVIGPITQYRPYWSDVYQAVSHSPVKVFEIDWREPANIILKTELGNAYFGPYSSRFTEQLRVLDRMRELPSHIQQSQIAFIDLRNPDFPAIQMKKGNETGQSVSH